MHAMVRSAALAMALLSACHVIERVPDLRPSDGHTILDQQAPRALPMTLVVTDTGRFRLVEPLVCASRERVEMTSSEIVRVKPNYATFVVGAILTSLGAVGTGIALGQGNLSDHPIGYAAPVALGAGLVLAIGPFVGTREDREYHGTTPVDRDGPAAPCGARPVAATRAILMWRGLRGDAAIDADGYLSISPYQLVDAFAAGRGPAFDVSADVTLATGEHAPVQAIIAGAQLAKGKDAYLASIGVDGRWEQLRKVPRVEPGALRASRTTVGGRNVLRVTLPLDNNGPGDAWQVRGVIQTQDPEVDGRILYVGHLAPHGHTIATVDIPLSDESDRALAGDTIELAVTLIDADATTSAEPARFKGAVLNDVPR
jgi:hypothetical protein